jgi:prepilin-type N-terminal cleavage/methylation domain-containing protein
MNSAHRSPLTACRLPGSSSEQRRKKVRQRKGEAGFTLIEVVMAVVILGLAYVAVLQSFSFSLASILRMEDSKRQTLAASMEFDELMRASGKKDAEAGITYPAYLEGNTYSLVLVVSNDDEFASLKLVRR